MLSDPSQSPQPCSPPLWLCRPLLLSIGNLNLIFFFVILLAVLIVIALPIAFTFILCTVSYLLITTRTPLIVVVSRMEEGMSSMVLLAIPLFVYLGLLIEVTGLARALVNFMASLLGHVRGGLAYVLLGAMFLVSGISGSKAADMAAVAPGLIPEMKRRGMIPGELAAMLGGSAVMTETIPPSLVLIMIGSATGISIGALFQGGLIPAVICTLALVIVVYFRAGRVDVSAMTRPSFRVIMRAFVIALPALALPIVIRTAVVEGVATATEVSVIGVIYTLLIGIVFYRELEWRRMYPILVATVSLTGAVLLILGMAIAMAWALTQSGFARQLVVAMAQCRAEHGDFCRLHPGFHRSRQRSRRTARDPRVRTALVPGVACARHPRHSLLDGDHHRDGHRALRATSRHRLLFGVRDRTSAAGRVDDPDLALSWGSAARTDPHCGGPVVLDRTTLGRSQDEHERRRSGLCRQAKRRAPCARHDRHSEPVGGERALCEEYLAARFKAAGLRTEMQEVEPNRYNVFGRMEGTGGGPTLLYAGHLDSAYGGDEEGIAELGPGYQPKSWVEDDWIFGLGAYNMKGGHASTILGSRGAADPRSNCVATY